MSTLSVRLPESVHKKLKELAKKEGVSMNQFISLAVSEKLSVLLTVDYLKERAKKGNRKDFEDILSQVPDVEPEDYDRL
ncbi:toxin-antitoxin system HicB family antitoxin [Natronogracilivirga saccharolytica]|uniref:Toxin-antitoxin system HicB family antitoxin n=1 Tax=Natronogracilivirga saccharolytica TaxID=2812953 RepID=A0A8J7USY6_9BACT|nr:toxin-antitoxin system HicB family antitoxin [Natronogracilivirga saccharolytica]MBP3192051.1 toxin-antitoxin system HicB family antitoxin [Natronogracilivirga saccharolytica]